MFRYCLIMAAGRGQRLQPLTDETPKALVKLLGNSLISCTIVQLKDKVDNIIVTTGFKGEKLVQHLYELGANTIIKTMGYGNAWWIFNSLVKFVNEPVLVLPCDNIVTLDLDYLYNSYVESGNPPCMLVPVFPVDGIAGDYIIGEKGIVNKLSRIETSPTYCSGIQVLNPFLINSLVGSVGDFNEVWEALILKQKLRYSNTYKESWYSINSEIQLVDYISKYNDYARV